jgi:hypothetical protein
LNPPRFRVSEAAEQAAFLALVERST